jgi:hypothetical protein
MELAFGTEANCAAYHQASCEKTVNSDDTLADLNDWLDTAGTMERRRS